MWTQGVATFQSRCLGSVDVLYQFVKFATQAIVPLNVEFRLQQLLHRLIKLFLRSFQVSGAIIGHAGFVECFNL